MSRSCRRWRWDRARRAACSIAIACVATVATLGFASSAGAHHIRGATYGGAHFGGGGVVLAVTPDGSGVSSFTVGTGGPAVGCFVTATSAAFVPPIPIVDHEFSGSSATFRNVNGSFDAVQRVAGTFELRVPPFNPCFGQAIRWDGVTTASPKDSEECDAAKAKVRTLVRRAKRYKRKLRKADDPKRKLRLRNKVKNTKKKLRDARKAADEACTPQIARG